MSTTPSRAYLDRRLELLVSDKFDALVDEGYSDGAVFVSFDGVVQGKDALREHFGRHLPDMGGVQLKSIVRYAESADTLFVEITVVTGKYGEVTTFEGFVLRDGKADYHFSVVK